MNIAAAYNVYDDITWLRLSYESIRDHVGATFFFVNEKPHSGSKSENSATCKLIDDICKEDRRAFKILGSWETEDKQRNFV